MRVLFSGGNGMLASAVVPYFQECGHAVCSTDINEMDVRDRFAVHQGVLDANPDIVCHLAAETSLEICENDPDHAWLTNAIGTRNVALECRANAIPMAYISSAGIFDGRNSEPYTEFDLPNPLNVYGATKYQGEQYVRQFVPKHHIVRAGWMMGGGPARDHKFISHIMTQIKNGAETIYAVTDKRGTPTYAPDFARGFEQLIQSDNYGTYHMVSPGDCTRFDIASALVEILGISIAVEPVRSTHFTTAFPAPRPASEAMRNYVLDLTGENTMRPWQLALAEYLKEWA